MKAISSLSILCLLILFSSAATAQTPDGDPPSQEDVCDGLSGAAYGLCNAYCEAMDCDSADTRASERACERKYQKFEALTGNPPPCEGVTCPCDNDEYPIFSSFADGSAVITGCVFDPGTMIMTIDSSADNAEVLIPGEPDEPVCSSSDPNNLEGIMITEEQAIECIALLLTAAENDLGMGACDM